MGEFFDDLIQTVEVPRQAASEQGEFWNKQAPTLDPNNGLVVRGGMWDPQRTWWNLPNFIKVLVGGYGCGKTNIGSKRMIGLALQNAPCSVAVVSPSFPLARQTTVATIHELLAGKQTLYGREFSWRYNRSTHEFFINYRGRQGHIIVYSGDRPLSLRGPNLAAAWIDEPFIQDYDVFEQMLARVRHPRATHMEICLTGTPEQLNWGYDLCMGEMEDKHDVGVVTAHSASNKAINSSYTERLERAYSEKAAQAFVEGKFVNLASGMVYYAMDPLENVVELERPTGSTLGVGMDFNVNPMAAVVFWQAGDHIHVFQEVELPNADTEYMAGTLRHQHGRELEDVYPDASGRNRSSNSPGGKSDFHYLREAGFFIHSRDQNPKRRDRYEAVNGKLKPRKGRVTLTISPRCKKLIKYLLTYSHETLKKQESLSHLLDAFSYPIAYLFPVDYQAVASVKLIGH